MFRILRYLILISLISSGYYLFISEYFNISEKYIFEEEIAKKNKKGIWQGNFMEPYVWRKNN